MTQGKRIIKVTGFKHVDDLLRNLAPKLANKLSQGAMRKAGKLVLESARRLVPVDSGFLKKTLALRVGRAGKRSKRLRAGAQVLADEKRAAKQGGQAYYAHMVEFGTQHTAPQPFLRPALETNKAAIETLITKEVTDAVAEAQKNL